MVIKRICRICLKEEFNWTNECSKQWDNNGVVYCPIAANDEIRAKVKVFPGWIKVSSNPPDKCPYLLEQIMEDQ